MKFTLSIILFFFSLGSVFAMEDIPTDLMNYKGYTNNVEIYCKLDETVPNRTELWSEWKEGNFLKREEIKYADITKKTGDEYYKNYLKDIHADPSRIGLMGLMPGPMFLEKASYVYKETLGAIYACAVMNAKMRIIENMLKIPTVQSNMKQKLQNQLNYMSKKVDSDGCRKIGDTSELSVKKTLLDNTTYQYCNYRHYLYYLDNASKKALDIYYKANGMNSGSASLLTNTDGAAMEIIHSANKITQEIAHTREVFPQAMVAFTEFEKTYASHIVLEFILQDYIDLRDSLKKLLNPIGQVIYKISNAQSPGK